MILPGFAIFRLPQIHFQSLRWTIDVKITKIVLGLLVGLITLVAGLCISRTYTRSLRPVGITEYNAQRLMKLKGVPHGSKSSAVANWCLPGRIVVKDVVYDVMVSRCSPTYGRFEVCATNPPTETVASGAYDFFANGKVARIHGFGVFTGCTQLCVVQLADIVSVLPLDANGNNLYLSFVGDGTLGCVVYKNFLMYIQHCSTSNAFDFVERMLNAGLPESERIVVTE